MGDSGGRSAYARSGITAPTLKVVPFAEKAIMTGFNRIGATWVGGDYDLLTGVVRGEWGFNGWIITDNANTGTFMDAKQMIEAGGDTKLTYQNNAGNVWTFEQDNPEAYHYAREAMHHLLYVTANSHVMNGAAPGATINYGLQTTDKIRIGVTAGGAAVIALVFWTGWRNHKKRAAERAAAAGTAATGGDKE